MKQKEVYHQLQDLAEKLGIRFSEKNFRTAGIHVNSGLCKIEGEFHFFMDKHKKISEKNKILAHCISQFQTDNIYIIPLVREYIEKI